MYTNQQIPRQRIPSSQKTDEWAIKTYKAYKNMSKFGLAERLQKLRALYKFYNGDIDDNDYKYVTQPYKKKRSHFPSVLRNYPIIKPVIDTLIGEKAKRPLQYSVSVLNDDAISLKEEAKQAELQSMVINMFAQGLQGQQLEEAMPAQIMQNFENSYVDNRAIKGQKSLNFLKQDLEIMNNFEKGWFHFTVAGEVYSHKGVIQNEVFYDILNPLDVDFDKDPDLEFVEDGDWAIVRRFAHASTLIDLYGDMLSEEQINKLENPRNLGMDDYLVYNNNEDGAAHNVYRNRLIQTCVLYWKSMSRIGFVTYFDEQTGSMEEFEIEDNVELPQELVEAGAQVEWRWINEVWRVIEIDDNIHIGIGPIEDQRRSMDNPSKCKLPVNGRKYSNINAENISIVSIGVPYQINYNIYKYRLENAIARSKDIIAQLDINLIPKKWDMDKFMNIIEGTGIAWVDYNKEGVRLAENHQTVLDMSIKVIDQYLNLLESIVMEWERVVGINRQRQGDIGEYEGKASSQQAILQSTNITEGLFKKYARFQQRELQGLLDYSKEAWLGGKKGIYTMPDGTVEQLDIDGLEHAESNYGVFVTDDGKELEKLDNAKSLSQAMMQNGVPASAILEMLDGDNFTEIKAKIKKAEEAQAQLEQAQQEAEMQMRQQEMQAEQANKQLESLDKEKDRVKDIEVALINAESSDDTNRLDFDLEKMRRELELRNRELDLKERELESKGNGQ